MNLNDFTNELELNFSSKNKFEVNVDHVSKEFHTINFNSLEKKQESFTVLILPMLPKDVVVDVEIRLASDGKKIELFGNNLKGGE